MANISAIKLPDGYTYTIVDNTSGWTSNEGTVTSVRVQASSPVQSSTSTAQNTTLNTTISLADGYGDTKNPYASKTKNYVLAAPSNAAGTPSFRALVAADIPDLSEIYLTSYTETDPVFLASVAHGITASDISNWNSKTSNTGTVKKVTAGVGLNTTSNDTATDGGDITTTGTLYLTKSGATAGSYGDSGNQTPSYGSTFKVPYITVDKYGRVTAITEHTVKIPASDNTNTTYTLSNALASHKFTETLTAGGSGSGTSTATLEFAAGTGISLQDDTTNKKITIGNTGVTSITTAAGSHTTKSSATGAVSFNVPTKTSHLTNDSDYTTKAYVDTTIANLPEPMIFKGSLGTDGTITDLPAAAAANEGYTYKVITADTYASQAAKVGDTFISDGSAWILIPSGDEPSGTVTSVKVQGNNGLTGSGTVTTSGTITLSHADTSSQSSISASARTYITAITLDTYGHVTALSTGTESVVNTDTKVNVKTRGTTKAYLLGTTTAPTSSNQAVESVAETGVYFDTTAATLVATTFKGALTGTASGNLTSSSDLDASKLTGTIPSSCYTDTTYAAGTGLDLSNTTFSVKLGYTTSGNNRAVQADTNGNLYVVQKDNNTTYSAGTGLSLSSTTFSVKLGYTTSGVNRAVQADDNGNLYVVQKDDNTTYTFDGTYNASTNKAATVSTVTNAIGALDGTITGTAGAGNTLTSLSQTDGKVTAVFGAISITKSQITDFPSSMTPSSHTHGNITNDGKITSAVVTVGNNDALLFADNSNGGKIERLVVFDGTTTTQALTKKGTWGTFLTSYTEQYTGTVTSVAATGNDGISITGSPITSEGTITIGLNLSDAINGLGEGTSAAQRDDYIVAQYAGGGTTTKTYHRRKLSNIFKALNSSDITTALGYTPYNSTNPNNYTSNTGTVTKVSTGVGLTGGDITTTGTIKTNLTSDTKLSNAALTVTEDSNRIYPIRIDKNSKLVVVVPWTNVNSNYVPTSRTVNGKALSSDISLTASDVGAATSGHTHTTSLAAGGTSTVNLSANTAYTLTAGGTSVVFKTPADANTWRGIQNNLTSTSTTDSLSAYQGKILNESKLSLTGGTVTGPVTFGDSVTIDEATIGDLVVNGSGSFTNNLQVNTINGVAVGSSPKFTDTVTTVSTTGTGNAITGLTATNGVITATKGTTFLTSHNTYTVTTSGSGNAVTAVSLSGTTFTVTKGATYSNNAGTITGVTAGTGLSGGGTSGTVTLNHSNSVTAQDTQAIYPIKIDAQGHISAYGDAVEPLTASSTLNATKLNGAVPAASLGNVKVTASGSGNAVTSLSASNGTITYTKGTTFLTGHQTIKQDEVTGATGNHYASCTTAAGTAAKTASITAGTPALNTGLRVIVKFSNANTANSPTLNINSLGAKNIFHNGAQITSGTNKALLAGTVEFVYDGTQWQLVGNYINTTYTLPTTANSNTTGITASTTANKTTVGSHSTDYGVKSAGSGSFTSGAFTGGSLVVSNHVLSFTPATHAADTHTHTAPTLGSKVPTVSTASATVSITDPGHTHTLS